MNSGETSKSLSFIPSKKRYPEYHSKTLRICIPIHQIQWKSMKIEIAMGNNRPLDDINCGLGWCWEAAMESVFEIQKNFS